MSAQAARESLEDLPPASDKRHYYVRPVESGQRGCLHGMGVAKFGLAQVCGRPARDPVHLPPPGRSADL